MQAMPVPVLTIGLLPVFNIFMTFGWYSHLKFLSARLAAVILISWGIALFDQVLMVPANRIGHTQFSGAEWKTIHGVITLLDIAVFPGVQLKEPLTRTHLVGFACIGCGAFFIFRKWA